MSTVEVKTENVAPKYRRPKYAIYVFIFERNIFTESNFYDTKIMSFTLQDYHKVLAPTCNDYFLKTHFPLLITHLDILIDSKN